MGLNEFGEGSAGADLGLFGVAMRGSTELEAEMRAGLRAVEQLMLDGIKSDLPFATEASRHLATAGGKRFRPLLTLLSSQFGQCGTPGVFTAGAVVELTHLATLYHDDVMDDAPMRRGAPSANSRWGNSIAILVGDFLFARASEIVCDLGPEVVRIQARTFERLVLGQIKESMGPEPGQDSIDHYLAVLADKTGSLISTSCRLGALLAGADEHTVDIVARFGERFGVAFQLSDDVLDIVCDPEESGKVPGTDLRSGVPTLPVLYARASTDRSSARLRELLAGELSEDDVHAEALQLLRDHAAMEQARSAIRRYAHSARDALRPLPEIPAKEALQALCDLVVDRSA